MIESKQVFNTPVEDFVPDEVNVSEWINKVNKSQPDVICINRNIIISVASIWACKLNEWHR